jgi:selenoprotein W-related protein
MAQEILSTFEAELDEVALVPSAEGGTYRVLLGEQVIFDRAEAGGGFPEVKALKQAIRDRLAPGRDLGHLDR